MLCGNDNAFLQACTLLRLFISCVFLLLCAERLIGRGRILNYHLRYSLWNAWATHWSSDPVCEGEKKNAMFQSVNNCPYKLCKVVSH